MQVTAASDFALRVLMHAALFPDRLVTVAEVTEAYGISRHHLVKIVHELSKQGFLETRRGVGGGFTLARVPEAIGVGEIVRLGEKSDRVIECGARREGPCRIRSACRLKVVFHEAADAFFEVLDGYSLADLVARPASLRRVLTP